MACGQGEIQGVRSEYRVRLRRCIVELKTSNCNIDLSSAYKYELPEAEISDETSITNANKSELKAEINATLEAKSSKGFVSGISSLLRSSKGYENQKDRKTRFKRTTMLIACRGDYWVVGDDEHSDPRRGGRLDERYFNENPDKPLCAIDVDSGASVAEARLEVRAKFGFLEVEAVGNPGVREPAKSDALDVSDAMQAAIKARLRGFAVSKAIA